MCRPSAGQLKLGALDNTAGPSLKTHTQRMSRRACLVLLWPCWVHLQGRGQQACRWQSACTRLNCWSPRLSGHETRGGKDRLSVVTADSIYVSHTTDHPSPMAGRSALRAGIGWPFMPSPAVPLLGPGGSAGAHSASSLLAAGACWGSSC